MELRKVSKQRHQSLARIERLNRTHPIAVLYDTHRANPQAVGRTSFLNRALSLKLRRNRQFPDLDDQLHELESTLPPVDHTTNEPIPCTFKIEKSKAAYHRFVSNIPYVRPLRIYTDGSAEGNPGMTGCAAVFQYGREQWCFGKPLGLGSSLSAEVAAIGMSLDMLNKTQGPLPAVYIFSDSSVAIDLASGNSTPHVNFEMVRTTYLELTKLLRRTHVQLIWIPAHHGILGNEVADKKAKRMLRPVPPFFPVPYSLSKALCRKLSVNLWQD